MHSAANWLRSVGMIGMKRMPQISEANPSVMVSEASGMRMRFRRNAPGLNILK